MCEIKSAISNEGPGVRGRGPVNKEDTACLGLYGFAPCGEWSVESGVWSRFAKGEFPGHMWLYRYMNFGSFGLGLYGIALS